ncbi:hypothetical protein P4K49_30870 [Bacillus cereus]|uniref:Uncharacterized protein n=1 Tax=Bacillus thuringiensis TaxID=1428 RepID=A0A9X6VF73_BACTU|nr:MULTISPECIES: hypothetical protein [Bacillus cereus group]MCU5278246.1 hypothetical protein [Bacillus cereus]AMR85235.1 hypothetical protein A3L20_14800 [Bacillus thuringiensis]MBG9637702.1 hypothetical protein [Bacillus thuringiensis]MBG9637847.1 hypothetical protein [Bacillus thuringiensis]MBG9674927.1 hypothetical protein [Bacillus thuringiensis]
MSETVKYEQMSYKQLSIYDFISEENNFLPEEKSQEVQPSETVPQVDEAQVVLNSFDDDGDYKKYPSSALDTSKLISENLVFNPEGYAEKATELPTEDTESTLFSVGDVLTVRVPDFEDSEPENYYFIKALEGKHFKVLDIDSLHITCEAVSVYDDKIYKFYHYEVRRVK